MANKLTQEQAQELLLRAYELRRQYPSLRLGQTIMNLMTLKQLSNVIGSESDFYNWTDEDAVMETFYKFCVEPLEVNNETC